MSDEKSTKISWEELNFPTFVNSCVAAKIKAHDENGKERIIEFPFVDVTKASILAGVSMLDIGDTRCGKSQKWMDIHRNYFGGDADAGGKSNWHVARNDFSADAFFYTIDQSKVGEGQGLLSASRVPVVQRVRALCNEVDELNLALPEVQVEYFGMAEGRHKGVELGERGYHLFGATCNLNRINGDFAGTSQINRALLNRFGITLDHDYFRRTDADDDELAALEASGRLKLAPLRDISEKILAANAEIRVAAGQRDPWLDAYIRVFSSGLDYCHKEQRDKRKKKIWPSKCAGCEFMDKPEDHRLCSLVKQSNTGTTGLLKTFVNGLQYLTTLKYGRVQLDPFEAALAAFQFTTYHGNLNGVETLSTYGGEDQEQMAAVIEGLREKIEPIKTYIDKAIDSAVRGAAETRFIRLEVEGRNTEEEIYSLSLDKRLQELKASRAKMSYQIFNPFESNSFAGRTGLRIDWFPGYLESVAEHYKTKSAENQGGD